MVVTDVASFTVPQTSAAPMATSTIPANTDLQPHSESQNGKPKTYLDAISIPDNLAFEFEPFLVSDLNLDISRDKASAGSDVCKFYLKGFCHKGANCQFKHARSGKTVVCKHWLRGLCKKGDLCEFLHEYNLKKMPECWFYQKYGECSNPECMYLHVDPESKTKECPWYMRGFCKLGPDCPNKHIRKALCLDYVTGFCPKGPECSFGHPKFEINPVSVPLDASFPDMSKGQMQYGDGQRNYRPLSEVTCFRCGEKGHYANHCPKRRRYDEAQTGTPIPTVS
ncbi:Cleavage and polyadenylation specificity factor subunit 4 [Gaertneriomyces sp. JEL0708]|nr:Cleavage and polyadenylation specificity factor subunit 4 [Gaertneriomyces sp. JEL0708]